MIAGFESIRIKNKHGGEDLIPYSELTIDQIDERLALANKGWKTPSVEWGHGVISKAVAKETLAELTEIWKAFKDAERNCEQFAVDQANYWADGMRRAAAMNENPIIAPANKNAVKDMMRQTRREVRSAFKTKYFQRYFELTHDAISSAIPVLTKSAVAENNKDRERLAVFGIQQIIPSPIVCGLLALRRYFIQQLVYTERAPENEQAVMTLNVDSDLLRMLGCEVE